MEGGGLGHELITRGGPKRISVISVDEKDQPPPFQSESDKDESKREGGAPTAHTQNPPIGEHITSEGKC